MPRQAADLSPKVRAERYASHTKKRVAGPAFPGAAPVGLDRSDTRALATGTLPSLRALEKNAAQLAAKATSSFAAELHAR